MAYFRKNYIILAVIVTIVAFYASWLKAENTTANSATAVEATTTSSGDSVGKPIFQPYLAAVVGSDVNIRSGPAHIYYSVGKLQKGQQVIVRGERHGKNNWAMIDPTPQCFSYVSKKFVKLRETLSEQPDISHKEKPSVSEEKTTPEEKAATPAVKPAKIIVKPNNRKNEKIREGVVTGNSVRVRAGSLKVPPVNARQVQTRLNSGAVVYVIGERDDFYKIVTPPGCHFWCSLDYLKRTGAVTEETAEAMQGQAGRGVSEANIATPQNRIHREMKEYRLIARSFRAEQEKPIGQRDFTVVKERLNKFLGIVRSPSAKASARILSRNLARTELALEALKKSTSQDKRLQETLSNIDRKMDLLTAVNDPPEKTERDIVVKGVLAPSSVFTAPNKNRRFLVLDDEERIIYYAVAGMEGLDLTPWLGKKVSLVGTPGFDSFGKIRILNVVGIVEIPPK